MGRRPHPHRGHLRHRPRRYRGYRPHPVHAGNWAGPWPRGPLLPVGIVVVAIVAAFAAGLVALIVTVSPALLAGLAVIAVVRHRRGRRMLGPPGRWPAEVPTSHDRDVPGQDGAAAGSRDAEPRTAVLGGREWAAAKARFADLRGEYGQFECDPLAVLRLPALTDVSVPSTARFVDAFAEAQALDTDTEPPPEHRQRYAAAVEHAWRTWRAALDAAERIRLSRVPAEERATVQRAIKLLTMARDSDHDAERRAAYARARTELAKLERNGVLHLPPPAAAAVESAARGQLPPATVTG